MESAGKKKAYFLFAAIRFWLIPFLGLSKLAQHIACKWLRRKTERSEEPLQPQAKHHCRGSGGCDLPPAEECICLGNTIRDKCQGEQA